VSRLDQVNVQPLRAFAPAGLATRVCRPSRPKRAMSTATSATIASAVRRRTPGMATNSSLWSCWERKHPRRLLQPDSVLEAQRFGAEARALV
jgi:hypothetical protein